MAYNSAYLADALEVAVGEDGEVAQFEVPVCDPFGPLVIRPAMPVAGSSFAAVVMPVKRLS